MEQLKTDTQETKEKVLGGNISGNLLNLVFREQSVPEQKQPNDSPPLQLWSNMWSKKISKFQVVRKWWKNTRFCPENAKNKAENEPFSALFGAGVHNGFD